MVSILPLALFALSVSTQDDAAVAEPANIGFYHGAVAELAHPSVAALDERGFVHVAEVARAAISVFDRRFQLVERVDLRALAARPEVLGLAIDEAGALWWSDARGARIHRIDPEGGAPRAFGEHGLAPGELHRPRGLDVRGGRVAVADEGNHRVEVYDLEGEHLLSIGGHGRGEGELLRPADVALSDDGRIYVADTGNARVQAFDADGAYLFDWGDFGPFPGLFGDPQAIEVRAERVFVGDSDNHRVQVFALNGRPLYEWGEHAVMPLQGEGKLHYPAGLAVSASGAEAVVVETLDDRFQVYGNNAERGPGERMVPGMRGVGVSAHYGAEVAFDGDWMAIAAPEMHQVLVMDTSWEKPRLVTHVGDLGEKPGLFLRPGGVALDGEAREVIVSDGDLRRVALFRLGEYPGGTVGYDPFMPRLVKSVDLARLAELDPAARLAAPPEPGALTLDGSGHTYVCDLRNDCVLVLDGELALERVLGRHGGAPGELRRPTALALDGEGNTLYVLDSGNARVQAFDLESGAARVLDLDGSVSAALGPDADGLAAGLHGLALGHDGFLYATDAWRHALVKLTPEGAFVRSIGARGLGRLEFRQPRGLAIGPEGALVIIDHANHRGQIVTGGGRFIDSFGSRPFIEPTLDGYRAPAEEGEED